MSAAHVNTRGCIQRCVDSFKDAQKDEQDRHLKNVKKCMGLSDGDKNGCLTTESARHSSAMQALNNAKSACLQGCHKQGRGNGG